MIAVADQIREGQFRNARRLSDGRMLVRWGNHFYAMDADELRRLQRWRAVYMAVQLGVLTIMATTAVLWARSVGELPSSIVFYGALLVGTVATFVDAWRTRRLKRRKQPDGDHDRLVDAWDRTG